MVSNPVSGRTQGGQRGEGATLAQQHARNGLGLRQTAVVQGEAVLRPRHKARKRLLDSRRRRTPQVDALRTVTGIVVIAQNIDRARDDLPATDRGRARAELVEPVDVRITRLRIRRILNLRRLERTVRRDTALDDRRRNLEGDGVVFDFAAGGVAGRERVGDGAAVDPEPGIAVGGEGSCGEVQTSPLAVPEFAGTVTVARSAVWNCPSPFRSIQPARVTGTAEVVVPNGHARSLTLLDRDGSGDTALVVDAVMSSPSAAALGTPSASVSMVAPSVAGAVWVVAL